MSNYPSRQNRRGQNPNQSYAQQYNNRAYPQQYPPAQYQQQFLQRQQYQQYAYQQQYQYMNRPANYYAPAAQQSKPLPKKKEKKRKPLVITTPDGSNVLPSTDDKSAESSKKQEIVAAASPNGETETESNTSSTASEPTTDKTVDKTTSSDATSNTVSANPTTEAGAQTPKTETKQPAHATEVNNPAASEQALKVDKKQHLEPAPLTVKQEKKENVSATAREDPKKSLAPLQTSLDDQLNSIPSPAPIKTPDTKNTLGTYTLERLESIRENCKLEKHPSWPELEVVNAVSSGRQNSRDARGGRDMRRNEQRRSYSDRDSRRNNNAPPRQWERGVRSQSSRTSRDNNFRGQPPFNPREKFKLKKTANGWSRDKHEAQKAQDNLAKIKTACNSLFNKLSVDNFERLLEKFMEMQIETRPQLVAAVAIIFDKALTMPTFCHLYARFCGEVRMQEQKFIKKIVKVLEEEHDGEKVYFYDVGDDTREDGREGPYQDSDTAREKGEKACTFKRVLLTQCQEVFESHSSWETAFNQQLNDESLSEKQKEKAKEEAELHRLKVKRRSLGIVQFVAHLYLNSLLSEKRVYSCMSDLLLRCNKELTTEPKPITEGVEVFAKIITEVGQKIDQGGPKSKAVMDAYMEQLKQIIKTKGLDSRTRFMIMDVIDLREKLDWVPRRKKAKMVTKAQFKKDAEEKLRQESRRNNSRRAGNPRNGQRGGAGFARR